MNTERNLHTWHKKLLRHRTLTKGIILSRVSPMTNSKNKSFWNHYVNSIYFGQETECPEPLISPDHLAPSPLLWLAHTMMGTLNTQQHSVSSTLLGWLWMSVAGRALIGSWLPLLLCDWLTLTLRTLGRSAEPQPVTRSQPSPQPFIWTSWPWTYLGHILSPVRHPSGHHGCRGRGWEDLRWPGGHQVQDGSRDHQQ